jgi:hypothetical protein
MGRLKRLDELTPDDHLEMIRKGSQQHPNTRRGRVPRVDDPDSPPSREELVEAGYAKPDPERVRSRSRADDPELRRARNELSRLEQDLDFSRRGGKAHDGVAQAAREARLAQSIAEQRAEIAAMTERQMGERAGMEAEQVRRVRSQRAQPGYHNPEAEPAPDLEVVREEHPVPGHPGQKAIRTSIRPVRPEPAQDESASDDDAELAAANRRYSEFHRSHDPSVLR